MNRMINRKIARKYGLSVKEAKRDMQKSMPDYKEMYLKLFRASEEAVSILIAVQRECEELYISQAGPELRAVPFLSGNKKSVDEE